MAPVATVPVEQAQGALRVLYDSATARAGKVFQILQVQSLNVPALCASTDLYLAAMHGPSGLSRREREIPATLVSWMNDCFY